MHWLRSRLREFGPRPAMVLEDGVSDYETLAELTDSCILKLETHGVAAGDVVAISGDHSPTSIAALLGCLEKRCIAVPLTNVPESEVAARCRIARVKWILSGDILRPALTGHESTAPLLDALRVRDSAGLVLFSSGTSGEPKAIIHDLGILVDSFRGRRAKSLSVVLFLLFDHIGGLNTLLNGLASGATLVIPPDRTPENVATMIARHRASVLPSTPTFLNLLLVSGCIGRHDLSSLRIISYGTEPMPDSLLSRLRRAFPTVKFIQTFGTSETGIARTISKSSDSTLFKFDDPDQEWRIVDGELRLRSKTRALGYLNADSTRFDREGWFHTGDKVEPADDGFLRITGRLSEIINVGGEKVMPGEVESVVMEVAGVRDVLVHGEPNPITGTVVAAVVVPEISGGSEDLKRAIRARCREKLAAYKVPVRVSFTDALATGSRQKKIRGGLSI